METYEHPEDLFPSPDPRKSAPVKRKTKREMVKDMWYFVLVVQGLESGRLSAEDRQWLAARLRRVALGADALKVFFPGHRKGVAATRFRDLAIAFSYAHRKLSEPDKKDFHVADEVAAVFGVGRQTVRDARKALGARFMQSVFRGLDLQRRGEFVSNLEGFFSVARSGMKG